MNASVPPVIDVPIQLQVRMSDEALRTRLKQFCNRTRLSPPEAARQLMWIALRDGIEFAASQLGEPADTSALAKMPKDRVLALLTQALELSGYKIIPARKGAAGNKRKRK